MLKMKMDICDFWKKVTVTKVFVKKTNKTIMVRGHFCIILMPQSATIF